MSALTDVLVKKRSFLQVHDFADLAEFCRAYRDDSMATSGLAAIRPELRNRNTLQFNERIPVVTDGERSWNYRIVRFPANDHAVAIIKTPLGVSMA